MSSSIKNRIFQTLKNLENLPRVTVEKEEKNGEINVIWIKHIQEYVPNFGLVWCPGKEHFRVYIHVAYTTHAKGNAGYCICTVGSGFAATGLVMVYGFLHKHRANNKGEAVIA